MKKILVPSDFSENANLALKHAIQVANEFGGIVNVVHIYQIATSTASFVSIDDIVKADREAEVADLIDTMKPLLSNNATIEGHVRKGNSVENICDLAKKMNVDIIIMGTKGAGGMKKMFMGSTASNVILNTTIPVLVIPNEFSNFKISNITLALDDKKFEDFSVLKPVLDLVKGFGAVLDLLTIIDEAHPKAKIDSALEDHLAKEGITYTYFVVKAPEILEGLRNFASREKSDMLCLVHHPRGFFQNIFGQSVAKEMAFDSRVPLLVIQG